MPSSAASVAESPPRPASEERLDRVHVVVPTRNAQAHLPALLAALRAARPAPGGVLFIDSASTDATQAMILDAGYAMRVIDPASFGHGRTRNLALTLCGDATHVVFLTQDAVPQGTDWLSRLLAPFARPDVAVSFGRQLPRASATIPERFARTLNYPDSDEITTEPDIARRGIKAVFCSNSYAAYDRARLSAIGGFPENLPLGEDMAATLRLLRAGHARCYCATATAVHSHDYAVSEEFRRYFDIGVLLDCDPELRAARLAASGEGWTALKAEFRHAWAEAGPRAAAAVIPRAAAKLAGFQLGRHYRLLPRSLCRRLGMHTGFWNMP